ncbi:hotdog fold thioesterase [Simiduia aestuariiviva]|uniref:1,4-dihydroxy-2-naphthoyl-CoA hydrolase n=1 Tax=Simiduia aestuariiviva TaxID=1510459 RepID=A0A839UJQ4_9GAMM|nr:hotdog fold thioesterase [Simiduia aestuariiviva]MBB3166850.1 1,4-dihydroxy-2-naphthoyl-CoA hydrolase [Simiduia aestuariiviva]
MTDTIWKSPATPAQLNALGKNTAAEFLGIEVTEVGPDFVRGTMPVSERTVQPMGLIHGGINVVLAETLGSMAANMAVDTHKYFCVGQEVNANHVRAVRKGPVSATARVKYLGRSSQVWEIEIMDERGRLSCISRLTMAVVAHVHP